MKSMYDGPAESCFLSINRIIMNWMLVAGQRGEGKDIRCGNEPRFPLESLSRAKVLEKQLGGDSHDVFLQGLDLRIPVLVAPLSATGRLAGPDCLHCPRTLGYWKVLHFPTQGLLSDDVNRAARNYEQGL